jgi:serine/threonine protein kinase
MPSEVTCANPVCSRHFAVPDDSRGRLIRCPHCQTRWTPTPGDNGNGQFAVSPAGNAGAPTRIGRFEVRERLSFGAFGTVYRAYDPQLQREVALKVLRPEATASSRAVERFQREAKAAARMTHAHIVRVFEAGQDGPHHFIASALVEGRTLSAMVPEGGMEASEAAQLLIQLANALDYAHRQGVIHRDVKPDNILVDEQGHLYLTDFGLAALTGLSDARLTQTGDLLGTPSYMSPEQAAGEWESVGPAADVYAAGAVLYYALTGRAPFEGPPMLVLFHHQRTPAPPPSTLRAALDPALDAICLRALAKTPDERYANAREMAVALNEWIAGQMPTFRQAEVQPAPSDSPILLAEDSRSSDHLTSAKDDAADPEAGPDTRTEEDDSEQVVHVQCDEEIQRNPSQPTPVLALLLAPPPERGITKGFPTGTTKHSDPAAIAPIIEMPPLLRDAAPAPEPSPEAVAVEPPDAVLAAATSAPARRRLSTKRGLYSRIVLTRDLIRTWQSAGKYLASPKRRLNRPSEANDLVHLLDDILDYLRRFPPLMGVAGQPGYLVVTLSQLVIVPTFQAMDLKARNALSEDWKRGLKLLTAHRDFLRQEIRVMRRQALSTRLARAFSALPEDWPALFALLLLALAAINFAYWRDEIWSFFRGH